ncbi:MAG: glycerate kinase [Saprospiraceae bacterium]|nr:glycerate kinase [Saprospiraceae bacterium]
MIYLLCPDKFRGSLTAEQVCQYLSEGILSVNPDAQILNCPMADGGEGSLEILKNFLPLEVESIETSDPVGRRIMVSVGINQQVCYIETARVIGLNLLQPEERNPLHTTTEGLGQLILRLIDKGIKEFHLFLGGSATNDAGIGMAAALGYRFFDHAGNEIEADARHLSKVGKVIPPDRKSDHLKFKVYADVSHVMYGPKGASRGFGRQKGADAQQIAMLDAGIKNFATILAKDMHRDVAHIPGSGAAGALAGGCMAFLHAEIASGVDFLFKSQSLKRKSEKQISSSQGKANLTRVALMAK